MGFTQEFETANRKSPFWIFGGILFAESLKKSMYGQNEIDSNGPSHCETVYSGFNHHHHVLECRTMFFLICTVQQKRGIHNHDVYCHYKGIFVQCSLIQITANILDNELTGQTTTRRTSQSTVSSRR